MDVIDGAEGGDVDAGTLARYSAPELGELMLAILLRFFVSMLVGDRSRRRSSSVRVRGRDELEDEDMVYAASLPLSLARPLLREVLRPTSIPATDEPCRLPSLSLINLLLPDELLAAAPPVMVVVVWGMKAFSKLVVPRLPISMPPPPPSACPLSFAPASSGGTARIVPVSPCEGVDCRRGDCELSLMYSL